MNNVDYLRITNFAIRISTSIVETFSIRLPWIAHFGSECVAGEFASQMLVINFLFGSVKHHSFSGNLRVWQVLRIACLRKFLIHQISIIVGFLPKYNATKQYPNFITTELIEINMFHPICAIWDRANPNHCWEFEVNICSRKKDSLENDSSGSPLHDTSMV